MDQCKWLKFQGVLPWVYNDHIAPYAAVTQIPLIKSPSLRVPRAVVLPPDIHPLPESVNAYFVYPFTLEPHVVTLESSRRKTIEAHETRREAYLRSRDDDKERRKRDVLRRIAPGFEPHGGPLVPTTTTTTRNAGNNLNSIMNTLEGGGEAAAAGYEQQPHQQSSRSVMDDLIDQLAALDSANVS